jgi:hypothetical protein
MFRKFKFHLNTTRITDNLHDDVHTLEEFLAQLFLEQEIFYTRVLEKIKTHILCSVTFFLPKIVPLKR